jgi:hypothetical protein
MHASRRAKITLTSQKRPNVLVLGFVLVREMSDFAGFDGAGGEN